MPLCSAQMLVICLSIGRKPSQTLLSRPHTVCARAPPSSPGARCQCDNPEKVNPKSEGSQPTSTRNDCYTSSSQCTPTPLPLSLTERLLAEPSVEHHPNVGSPTDALVSVDAPRAPPVHNASLDAHGSDHETCWLIATSDAVCQEATSQGSWVRETRLHRINAETPPRHRCSCRAQSGNSVPRPCRSGHPPKRGVAMRGCDTCTHRCAKPAKTQVFAETALLSRPYHAAHKG